MALADLFTTAELEIACGGPDRLVRLAKAPDASSAIYTAFIAQVRRAAQGDLYSIIEPSVVLSDSNVALSDFIQSQCLPIGVYWAHHKGTGGQAIPDEVKGAYATAKAELKEFRAGDRSLGTETEGARNAPAHQVDMDATGPSGLSGSGWTRGNFGGYC